MAANVGRHSPAHICIARSLGVAIVTGVHEPGSLLPGEIEFAAMHGVSRSVIRESLRVLGAKGLIESRPKTGTRVRERAAWNLLDPELLGWMFEGVPSRQFFNDLFQLRMIVEPAAAEVAATSRTANQLSRMGHCLELMAQHGLQSDIGQSADQQFHATMLEATHNELLVNLSGTIAAAVRWTTFFKYRASRHPRDGLPEHRALFETIANADPAAARRATEILVRQAQLDTEEALGG